MNQQIRHAEIDRHADAALAEIRMMGQMVRD
jgi:hypothetical protein